MLQKNQRRAVAIAIALVALVAPPSAKADFRMRLERIGGNGVVVTDQGTGDSNSDLGLITVISSLGGGATISTGVSQPLAIGLPENAYAGLDLNSMVLKSQGAGTYRLSLQATGYSEGPNGPLSVIQDVGGTASGISSMTFRSWANASNLVQDYGADSPMLGPLAAMGAVPVGSVAGTQLAFNSNGAFSGSNAYGFTKSGLYSLFLEVEIVFTGSGTVSLDYSLLVTPEPATIVAALSGLPLLGGFIWRRRKAVCQIA